MEGETDMRRMRYGGDRAHLWVAAQRGAAGGSNPGNRDSRAEPDIQSPGLSRPGHPPARERRVLERGPSPSGKPRGLMGRIRARTLSVPCTPGQALLLRFILYR